MRKERFENVAVIGAAGKIGEFFVENLAHATSVEAVVRDYQRARFSSRGFRGQVNISTNLGETRRRPDAIIVATSNPIDGTLQEIKDALLSSSPEQARPVTLILPQNGIGIGEKALEVFKDMEGVNIIRASLFTVVSRDQNGNLQYNPKKKRIALAAVPRNSQLTQSETDSLEMAKDLFIAGGFKGGFVSDHRTMEAAKLESNMLGLTGVADAGSPRQIFRDKKRFSWELKALKDRRRLLRSASYPPSEIPWLRKMELLHKIPEPLLVAARHLVAEIISRERNHQPTSAAGQLHGEQGKTRTVEALDHYLRPILDLANQTGMESPLDRALHRFIRGYWEKGSKFPDMEVKDRVEHLLEVANIESQKVMVRGNRFKAKIVEKLAKYGIKKLEVTGVENIQKMMEMLESGRSVLITPNHISHADHPSLMIALREVLGDRLSNEQVVFIAGMLFGKDLLSKTFDGSYSKILVWTTRKGTSADERSMAKIINEKAAPFIDEVLGSPQALVVYPEGGRGDNLREPIPAVAFYFGHENTAAVFPVAINGTDGLLRRTNPNEKGFKAKIKRVANTLMVLVPGRSDVSVHFCEPVYPEKRDRKALTEIMQSIALRVPEERRGPYSNGASESVQLSV